MLGSILPLVYGNYENECKTKEIPDCIKGKME